MKPKQPTRKELLKEPDQFLTWSSRFLNWVARYQKAAMMGLTAVAGILLVGWLVNLYLNYAGNQAFAQLTPVLNRYEAVRSAEGPAKALEATTSDYESVINGYKRYAGGRLAMVSYARAFSAAGQYEQAVAWFTKAREAFEGHPYYQHLISLQLGYALVAKSDLAAAATTFEMISGNVNAPGRDEALVNLAAIYGQLQQPEKRKSALEKLVQEFPKSPFIAMARELIRQG